MTKRILCTLCAALLLACAVPVPSRAMDTSATAAILVDETSGEILYEKNPDKRMLIASITKIMTAMVAIRDGNLDSVATVSRHAANTEGSSMYLKTGEQVTLRGLLYGLLMRSGNDAAVAIAEHVAGSEGEFVYRMNALAKELGMTNSSFANPHGLNQNGHYSTARDMAKAMNAAMNSELIRLIMSTRSITINGHYMVTQNKLLDRVDGCVGGKTGYTKAAGRTLVSCVEREGRRLVCVTLKDSNDWNDQAKLYEYGFSLAPVVPEGNSWQPGQTATPAAPAVVETKRLTASGDYFGEAPVKGGLYAYVPVMAASEFSCPVPEGALVSIRTEFSKNLVAPVYAGDKGGEAVIIVNGEEKGRVNLICSESIPADAWSTYGLLNGLTKAG